MVDLTLDFTVEMQRQVHLRPPWLKCILRVVPLITELTFYRGHLFLKYHYELQHHQQHHYSLVVLLVLELSLVSG